MDKKKEYLLEGLCCANCAAKIEREVSALSGVKEANINLMNSKMSLILEEISEDFTARVKKIVAKHESDVIVYDLSQEETAATHTHEHSQEHTHEKSREHTQEHGHSHGEKKEGSLKPYLIRILLAVALSALFSLLPVIESIKLVGFIVAYILVGYEILFTAGKNILKGQVFDENFLMGIASLGAFLIGDHTEAVAVLVFYGVGELLQDMAVNNSKKNIAGLMDIRPDYANKLMDGAVTVVSPEQVVVGDIILVKPGEKIPLDGVIRKGSTFVDTRALTGESVPREVNLGEAVLSGTINTSSVVEVEVTKPFGESTVSKILELVQNAGSKKAESEKFITKFARYYTPFVVFTAVAVAIIPPVLGFGSFSSWLYRALSFLIISCPCALVISIPLSFFGGIGGGAKHGVLIKGGNFLEALKQVDTIVFDKTGTLTKGVFEVSKIAPVKEENMDLLLQLAAIAESNSTHPIAKSIIKHVNKKQIEILPADGITEVSGKGVIAAYEGKQIFAGNEKLMQEYAISYEEPKINGSIVYVALDQVYMGYILITDEVKLGVSQMMAKLKELGVRKTVMLTGDHENAAQDIASICNVDEYKAELLPQDKVAWFEKYKKAIPGKGKIVFVGDGINDAPVLAGADIGIAMGGIGSDAAIEAADVVIMNDDITKMVTGIRIARKTNQIVIQNIVFALGVKAIIMVLAFLGLSSIWFAIFADVGVALLALLNAMRAMYIK